MTSQTILVLLAILSTTFCFPSCKQVHYNYYSLALTWPNQFCSQSRCVSNWTRIWDGKSMVIHGFWPSSTDLSYLSCFRDHQYDPYCFRDLDFSQRVFTAAEMGDLRRYWPQLGSIQNFWGYEWDKHGTCYLHIMNNKFGVATRDDSLMRQYFTDTISKVKRLNIQLNSGTVASKTGLARQIRLHASEFYAICGRDNQLDEIRICYDVSRTPGLQPIKQCPASSDRSQCTFPIVIR